MPEQLTDGPVAERIARIGVDGLANVFAFLVTSCGQCPIALFCDHLDGETCESTWAIWLEQDANDNFLLTPDEKIWYNIIRK
jgi:hypothetical protein